MELREVLQKKGFTLRLRSDTEVLLYPFITYGATCLSMMEGMYAFAIWDEVEGRLFLARDWVALEK